jgi:GTP cyclohydrolase I
MNLVSITVQNIEDQDLILKNHFYDFIKVFDNPEREGLINTPERMVKAYRELLTPIEPKITVFDSNGYDQMIIEKNIEYYTFCEHHLLPFFGTVKIGYIPAKKIIGLSKLPRIVEYFSHRLNTQEYFTQNIANYLQEKLEPLGIGVLVTGSHLCQKMRGVKKHGDMVTSALKGIFLTQQSVKEEFLGL